jgi:hypothetical protein
MRPSVTARVLLVTACVLAVARLRAQPLDDDLLIPNDRITDRLTDRGTLRVGSWADIGILYAAVNGELIAAGKVLTR